MSGKKLRFRSGLAAFLTMGLVTLAVIGPARAEIVHFKQLIPLVDLKLAGWKMEAKPIGTTMKQGEIAMSQAQVTYRSGDKTLEIVVMDFMGKNIPFLGAAQQLEMETSEETLRTTTIQGFKGLETFRTQEHHGELNLSVADRFWVKIEGNGIDNLEVLRAVAQQMNLPKLAELAK